MKFFIPILLLSVLSCKKERYECVNSNTVEGQIFNCTYLIEIPPYSYIDSFITGTSAPATIEIFGDATYFQLLPPYSADVPVPQGNFDNFTQHYQIQYATYNLNEMIAGIFTEPIITSLDFPRQILNLEKMIWTWNTSLSADDGVINYNEGVSVSVTTDGVINYLPLTLLDIGKTYYIAMWGYNDEATVVEYSSRQIEMKIIN
ncbi:MAG: hypothetical protein H7Y00_04795 [Fimbriimonadaceae bacterium]|nr:hypothetical protein [Chitinophagales bacterium]